MQKEQKHFSIFNLFLGKFKLHQIKMTKSRLFLFFLLYFLSFPKVNSLCAQQSITDSLQKILPNIKDDTARLNLMNEIAKYFSQTGQYDETQKYTENVLSLSRDLLASKKNEIEKSVIQKNIGNAYNMVGYVFESRGSYPEALKNYNASLEIRLLLNNKKNIAGSLSNIGNVYYFQGNYPEALRNYYRSLKIREEIGDKRGIANIYGNIAGIYYSQGNYSDALKNYKSALKIREDIGDKHGIAFSHAGIGAVYFMEKKYSEAIENHEAAIRLSKELDDKHTISDEYNNLGVIYNQQAEYNKALNTYSLSLKMREEMNDSSGIASSYINIGDVYLNMKKIADAKNYLQKGIKLALNIGSKEIIKSSYYALVKIDSIEGNFKQGFIDYKKYILYRDSLNNEVNTKKIVQSQMQYEFDKKDQLAKSDQDKKDAIAFEEKRKQKTILISVISGLGLMVFFAIFLYRSYLQKRKANIEITKQKEVIEHKQKEILDSIRYAKRIQQSLLPTEKYIERQFRKLNKK
jgi:tetratricopeptide (TPR) repeat protein